MNKKTYTLLGLFLIILGLIPMCLKFLNPQLDNSNTPYGLFVLVYVGFFIIFNYNYHPKKGINDELLKSIDNKSNSEAFKILFYLLGGIYIFFPILKNYYIFDLEKTIALIFLIGIGLSIATKIYYSKNPDKI